MITSAFTSFGNCAAGLPVELHASPGRSKIAAERWVEDSVALEHGSSIMPRPWTRR